MEATTTGEAVTTAAKGRGKRLTDSERMEIIARLEDKTTPLSRAKCARIYGVTPAAISKLMKVSQTVKKRYADAGVEAGHLRDKRQRGGFSKNMCFEDELFKWICSIRARRIPLLVAHVQQKAKLLAAKHQMNDDFKASNGWYYRFCARYGLAPGSLHAGGSGGGNANTTVAAPSGNVIDRSMSSDSDDSSQLSTKTRLGSDVKVKRAPATKAAWSEDPATAEKVGSLQDQVKKFGPEFVYSLSEARLFYKLLPHQLIPTNQQTGGDSNHSGESDSGGSQAKGNTERVMVLVCANGTGTHKIPLLVVGKQARPVCFAVNQHNTANHFTQLNTSSSHDNLPIQSAAMQVGSTKYYSQRDVWCDNQTFQYWCTSVFAPAVQARTTQPVLLLMDNPGGSLDEFQFGNIATYFLPTRAGNLSAALQSGAASSTHAQFQPLQHGVVRELKRRYKIALFHEALSFLEKGDEERYRLLQRALNRPQGAAGIAFGRLPHVADAMALLEEVWAAIPVDLLRTGWVRSNLYAEGFPELHSVANEQQSGSRPDISDDTVVLELSSMLRHVKSIDELQGLPKEIRLWMYADDDASERMQQELLHDVQRLLQEEEEGGRATHATAVVSLSVPVPAPLVPVNTNGVMEPPIYEQHHQQHGSFTSLMHSTGGMQQQQQHPVYGDFNMHQQQSIGYGYSLPQQQHHHQLHQQAPPTHFNRQLPPPLQQQQHHLHQQHLQQQQQQHGGSPMALRESRKAVIFALRALANAEEALDNTDVAEHFGDEATSDAIKAIGAVLRRLRRIHRGKQSTLAPIRSATTDQANSGLVPSPQAATSSAHDVAASTHTYFYGDAK